MTDLTLSDVSKKMRKIDICMMTTKTTLGLISCRPMLNYTEPEYDGNSYFFSLEDADVIKELKADNVVNLSFQNDGKFYASMLGHATISNTKEELEAHWIDSLNKWS